MSLDANVLDGLGPAAGLALAIKATLVLAIGAAAAWMLRRRSAAGRHFVWLLTMNAVLGVTAFAMLTRGVAVEVPRWPQWASERAVAPAPDEKRSVVVDPLPAHDLIDVSAGPGVAETPMPRPAQATTVVSRAAGAHESGLEATAHATPAFETPLATPSLATPSRPAPPRATLPAAVANPAALLIAVWLAGTGFLLGRLALAHLGLAWVARRSHIVEDRAWLTLLRCLAREAGVARPPRLCWSTAVGTPIACGLFRPSILLPLEAQSWEPERRRVVLLHELAHIARRDPLTQSIAWLACAIYWFQPAAWLAFTRLRAEGERACDDRVLSTGVAGPDYASHLLSLARRARTLRLAGAVSVAMARGSTLEGRLLALLDDGVRRGSLGLRARGAGMVTLALVLFTVGLVRPVPPAAAVARAASSESRAPLAPATPPIQAPAVARRGALSPGSDAVRTSYPVIPAEPAADLASEVPASAAVDAPTALAFDASASPATESAEAGVQLAPSMATTHEVARVEADAAAQAFSADPPARPSDKNNGSQSAAAPARPPSSLFGSFMPVPLSSTPAPAPAPAPPPTAGARTWRNQTGGLWSDPKNWTPNDVPDAPGESAVLPSLGSAYRVTLDISPAIDAISIDASDATLDMSAFSIAKAGHVTNSGTIANFAGVYNSDQIRNLTGGTVLVAPGGTIEIGANALWNAGTIVAAKAIHWGGAVVLWGGGALVLKDTRLFDPNDSDPELLDQDNKRITIAQGTTLRGTGTIEKHYINNSGLIQADVAQLPSAPEKVLWLNGIINNRGTIRVQNGGHINVNRPLVVNREGLITSGAGGGSFRLEMPSHVFGSISALPPGGYSPPQTGGIIRADGGDLHVGIWNLWDARIQRGPGGGDVILDQSTTMQDPIVEAGSEVVADWFTSGSVITNHGTVRLRKSMNGSGTSAEDRFSINGTGELILEGATIGTGIGATFVNGAGHTISGCGTINPPFINEGTVSLNCSGGQSARIGGQVVPANRSPDGTVEMPSGAIENRGRISIARGDLSICGPSPARYPIEVAVPTVIKNKGTIAAAGGHITLEKSVTLDNTGGGVLKLASGVVSLGGMTGATIIGGRLDAVAGSPRKAENLRGAPGFDNTFRVEKAATLRDVTLGSGATMVTAAGGVTTASGARLTNEGTNRIAGTFTVSPGTAYFQTTGETVLEGGEFLGAIMRGVGRGDAGIGPSAASIATTPATLRFYARSEARGTSLVLELPQEAELKGRLYDAAGREVARLVDGMRNAGVHTFVVGGGVPNGIYFARMIVTSAGGREVLRSKIAVVD